MILDDAKSRLMQLYCWSEPAAFHAIRRMAMNRRIKKEAAAKIILESENPIKELSERIKP